MRCFDVACCSTLRSRSHLRQAYKHAVWVSLLEGTDERMLEWHRNTISQWVVVGQKHFKVAATVLSTLGNHSIPVNLPYEHHIRRFNTIAETLHGQIGPI